MKDNVAPAPARSAPSTSRRFAKNLARMVEEGGKALAAYMKPREEGQVADRPVRRDRPTWSRRSARSPNTGCPTRSARSNCRSRLGQAYLELWGAAVKRLAGEEAGAGRRRPIRRTSASPIRNGRRTSSSISSSRPICSAPHWADQLVKDAEGLDPHTRQKAEFYVRQIANALSPSNFVLTNPELLRETLGSNAREPRARHAHAGRGHRGRRRRSEDPPVRRRRNSRSAAISRSRPAR